MQLNEKIEIMLGRRRMRKTEFADKVGITYRAFANYMNGSRRPRPAILKRIADELDMTTEFLLDDEKDIELTIEERFIKRRCRTESERLAVANIFQQAHGLFAGNTIDEESMEDFLECILEIHRHAHKDEK